MKDTLLFSIRALCFLLVVSSKAQQPWVPTNSPANADRYDDIYFVSPDTGWAVTFGFGGNTQAGALLKTVDGGNSWQKSASSSYTAKYRDIGFLNTQIGFVGTLMKGDGAADTAIMYKTIDGGTTWAPVPNFPGPRVAGICGMHVINDSTLYACGRYNGPAGFYKTTNRGNTWTYKDMSALAGGLVDIHFFDPDTGFVVGSSGYYGKNNGIVLFTTDGGDSWQKQKISSHDSELCWKISFPTRNVGYISLESFRIAPNDSQFCLKTIDGGITWNEVHYCNLRGMDQSNFYNNNGGFDAEGIGFINEKIGWIGGRNRGGGDGFSTIDGGQTWQPETFGVNLNRFRYLNDTVSYFSGQKIYKYKRSICAPINTVINDTICAGGQYIFKRQNLNTTGTYIDTITLVNSCDSLVTLILTVLPYPTTTIDTSICKGSSYSFANTSYSIAGTYIDTIHNIDCDSLVILNLTIRSADTSVTQTDSLLFSNATDGNYQWIDCISNAALTEDTLQSFVAPSTGQFAVIVQQSNCEDTSSCYNITITGIKDISAQIDFIAHTDASGNLLILQTTNFNPEWLTVFDINGKKVVEQKFAPEIEICQLQAGIYFIEASQGEKTGRKKFVKL